MTTEGADRFDGILLNVAQQAGSIENILDVFFGFLQRKTDFFSGEVDPSKPEKMVLDSFKKHHKCGQKKRDEEREKNRISDEQRRKKVEEQKKRDLEEYDLREREKKEAKIEEVSEDTPLGVQKADEEKVQKTDEEKVEKSEPEEKKEADDDDDDQTPQPLGNGGSTDKYTWTQTLSTLELMVHVRPGIRAKEVILDIGVDKLKVQIKGEEPIILGKLHSKVKPDDSMWTLIDNKIIQVSLEKLDQMKWWSCVMEGDPEINTRKIVPENSKLGDLDGETRQTVEKMMFDQRAKAAGLPTSDQQKQHEMLDKFKAQHPEMDFSNCKMNYGGGSGGGFNFN
eukprot:GEMP01050076.1.p1 GENE.GEMP01050076.1~~GEMP01050076.1.p1  ORF type:complete len:339 (+),score=92.75 GEMP01050076.1:110-1126(+)